MALLVPSPGDVRARRRRGARRHGRPTSRGGDSGNAERRVPERVGARGHPGRRSATMRPARPHVSQELRQLLKTGSSCRGDGVVRGFPRRGLGVRGRTRSHPDVRKTARSYLRAPLRYDRAPPGTTTRRRVRPRRTPRRRTTGTRSPRPRPHTRRTSKHSGGCPPHFRVAGIRRRSDRAGSDACVRRLSGD